MAAFDALVYSPDYCFGAEPECKGQIMPLRWGIGGCMWNPDDPTCREIHVWGTMPAPALDYQGPGKIYVTMPPDLWNNGKNTDGRGSMRHSSLQARLDEMNDDGWLRFHVNQRNPERWRNSQIDATWVHSSFNR